MGHAGRDGTGAGGICGAGYGFDVAVWIGRGELSEWANAIGPRMYGHDGETVYGPAILTYAYVPHQRYTADGECLPLAMLRTRALKKNVSPQCLGMRNFGHADS